MRWVCREFPREYRPTPRQVEVLWALVQTNGTRTAMADRLGISTGTVEVHLGTLMRELDLHTRVEVAVWWLEVGRYQRAVGQGVMR